MYLTADGHPIVKGAWYWNNDLRQAQVTELAVHTERNENTDEVVTWHKTTHGLFDGSRLALYHPFTRQKAEAPCTTQ